MEKGSILGTVSLPSARMNQSNALPWSEDGAMSPARVVRAKMKCTQVISHDGGWQTIKFACQYDGSKEDQGFSEATPSGSAEFTLTKKSLIGHYKPGKCYYFDVVEAD